MGVNNEPSVMLFYSGMAFRSTKLRESYAPDKNAAWVRESVIVRRIRARDTCAPDAAQRAASRMVRCRAGAARNSGVRDDPGSAERHEGRRTASGTRDHHANKKGGLQPPFR